MNASPTSPPDFLTFVPQQRFGDSLSLSPDGRTVAWVANTSGLHNAWLCAVGGVPRQLTHYTEETVRTVAWSRDGHSLCYTTDTDGDEQYRIWLVAADGTGSRLLTTAEDAQHQPAGRPFSPDGRLLVYSANDRDAAVHDLLVHDLHDGSVRRVVSTPGNLLAPVAFSPDGRWLLAACMRTNSDSDAVLVDLQDPDLTPRTVTAHAGDVRVVPGPWAPDSASFWLLTDLDAEFLALGRYVLDTGQVEVVLAADWDVESVVASGDGQVRAWTVNHSGRSVLHVERGGSPMDLPALPAGVIEQLAVAEDGSALVFLLGTGARPREVVRLDLTDGRLDYLTESRPPGLRQAPTVDPQLVGFPTHDGWEVPAWLYRPLGEGPFPMVLSIHGGPEFQERAEYNYSGLYQHLLSQGIGVLAPNVRGSTGYGKEYQRLIHRDWGGHELRDLEHAHRYLGTVDWVDSERVAVFGGSFGGFAALSCLSRLPTLWAAGVSLVGPSNLMTFVRSVPPFWRPIMASWVGDPEQDEAMLVERSPLTYADAITAPLMVIQGGNDPRVAQAESEQIVERLRARGVVVRYDLYPDEGHGFSKRDNEIAALRAVSDFLAEHLLGTPDLAPTPGGRTSTSPCLGSTGAQREGTRRG